MSLISKLQMAQTIIQTRINQWPKQAIWLGSGLSALIKDFEIHEKIPLTDLPFHAVANLSHMDNGLYLATISHKLCWIVGGRIHHYEGYSGEEITFLIRLLAYGGCDRFLLTNASGSVDPQISKGSLVLIDDHINWSLPSPLIGENEATLGPRYPQMLDAYDEKYRKVLLKFAAHHHIQLHSGIYLGVSGPQLETKAEYQLFHKLGAHIIGMSTIPEVIAARHMNKSVTALSMVSNDISDIQSMHVFSMQEFLQSIEDKKSDILSLIDCWLNCTE